MSAKAFYHKSPPVIPALENIPPEIWSTIIQHAAGSGLGLYNHEMTPSECADFIRGVDKPQMRNVESHLRTRNYLARVNKAWYGMALPFLYEYVHLGRGRSVLPLCKALLHSKEVTACRGSGCAFGWWTKRLDISIRDNSAKPSEVVTEIADMVACFPNLRILTFLATGHGYDTQESSHILKAVSCAESLKAIHWYAFSLWPSIGAWTTFLEHHTGLQSLRGPFLVDPGNQIALKSLKALHPCFQSISKDSYVDLSGVDLPSVRCLSCDNRLPDEELFNRLGRQLSIIQINSELQYIRSTLVEEHLSTFFVMRTTCHNLVQLNLNIFSWQSFNQSYAAILSGPKSLKILGLRIDRTQIAASDMRKLLQDGFPLVKSNNRNLTTIQLLASKNVKSLRQHPRCLKDGIQRLASLGVTLKDNELNDLELLLEPAN